MQFTPRELQLLTAAIDPDPIAATASWRRWSSQISLEDAPYPERRLLSAVYGHLSLIAPAFDLPSKMRGKARATFAGNHLIAREIFQLRESLSAVTPVILSEAIGICLRFNAWATRDVRVADIHISAGSLKNVGAALSAAGWDFQSDDILRALADPEAASFSTLIAAKGHVVVRIHWRFASERIDGPLTRALWADAESIVYLGNSGRIQSAEDSLVTILCDRLKSDDRSDALLSAVDAARLLPVCRPERLASRLATASLVGSFRELTTLLRELGAPEESVVRITSSIASTAAAIDSITPDSVGRERAATADVAVTRKAAHFFLWHMLGRRARIERMLLRFGGPFFDTPKGFERRRDNVAPIDFDLIGYADGAIEGDDLRIILDPADIRVLIPLPSMGDHTVIIEFVADDMSVCGGRINVFANGRYLATLDREDVVGAGQWRVFVPGDVLFGRWVELSLRAERVDAKQRKRTGNDMTKLALQRLRIMPSETAASLARSRPRPGSNLQSFPSTAGEC
jgi:hypothetical protein